MAPMSSSATTRPPAFTCEICGDVFTNKHNKSRHKKNTHALEPGSDELVARIAFIETRMQVMANELAYLKGGCIISTNNGSVTNYTGPVTNTNSHNVTNNNVTNNNVININPVNFEEIGHILSQKLDMSDIAACVLDLIVRTHFDKAHPENMNCFVGQNDQSVVNMMVSRQRQGWKEVPMEKASDNLTIGTLHVLNEHVEKCVDRYKAADTRRLDGFVSNMFDSPKNRKEINTAIQDLLIENSKQVRDTHEVYKINPRPPTTN
jgi:hypothetical protein